jgi:hypothetical protein
MILLEWRGKFGSSGNSGALKGEKDFYKRRTAVAKGNVRFFVIPAKAGIQNLGSGQVPWALK